MHKVRGDQSEDVTDIAEISEDVTDADFSVILTPGTDGFDANFTYRIVYNTCTIDGQIDDHGTQYTNEATVNGGSTGEVGVEQDWYHDGEVSKYGYVRGGEDRNGVIDWTVTITGDHLAGQDSFTVSDELNGPHKLCQADDGAYEVRGLSVQERYGPSEVLLQNLDEKLTSAVTVNDAGDGFEVEFEINDDDFSFQDSDKYLYQVRYQSCATTDGLPEGGQAFNNSVTVEGKTFDGEAQTPGRGEGKSGRINTNFVELNDEEYFPQTTMNWNVTIPGEKLTDIHSDLELTDTLTDSHQICEAGGDVKSNLGFTLEARDQIDHGGLDTVDLTDSVEIAVNGNEINFTVPQPELVLPDGSTFEGFSHEYQYVLNYTTCTTSGGMDASGTEYGNSIQGHGLSWGEKITQHNSGSGTGQGVARGSIAIEKLLDDESAGAEYVADGTVFTVHVAEFAPDSDEAEDEYDLEVPLNGEPVSGFNPRGKGWSVELSEPKFPDVPGVTFGEPVFTVDGENVTDEDGKAIVELTPGDNVAVELTNSADLGSLEIEKLIEGGAADLVGSGDEFSITAEIDVSDLGDDFPEQEDQVFNVSSSESYVLEDLPIGAEVSFSETLPEDDEILTWGEAVISPEMITVEPEQASTPTVITVTNQVERTVGTFTLSKDVTGEQADNPAVPDEVEVEASWDEEGAEGEKTLTIPTDGSDVDFGEDLLIGTEVHLSEKTLNDGSSIAWGAPVWSGTGVEVDGNDAVVTIGRDGEAHVTLENHAATSTAGISVLKGIAGEATDEVGSDTEFPVTATWQDADGKSQSKQLQINAQEPTELGEDLPAGTEVTITEGDRPGIDTVDWGSIVISGENVEDNEDGSAVVTVSDQQGDSTLISITNEATWAPGTFSLAKDVDGVSADHPDVPDSVNVTATWVDEEQEEQSKELTVPTDGSVVAFGDDLPHETEVTLTETPLEDAVSFTWNTPTWSGDRVEQANNHSATVTIAAADMAEILLTNEANPKLGSLVVTKDVTGTGSAQLLGDTTFPVTATWTDLEGQEQQQDVNITSGESAQIDDVLLGVDVELTEGEADLSSDLKWKGAQWSTDDSGVELVVGDADTEATATLSEAESAVSLTNTIDENTSVLPRTGAEWMAAVGVGLLFIMAGAGLYRRTMNRN